MLPGRSETEEQEIALLHLMFPDSVHESLRSLPDPITPVRSQHDDESSVGAAIHTGSSETGH